MTTVTIYTAANFFLLIDETWGINDPEMQDLPEDEREEHIDAWKGFCATVRKWIDEGKGIAVYENHDMGHAMLGHKRFFSYGNAQCQFEDGPPERLPDFPGEINWRYRLIGTYRKVD